VASVEGVPITNPDRPVYPALGLTKLDVARYFARVASLMLPHVADRPLTFVRCPEGLASECFYQKHWTGKMPKTLGSVAITQRDGNRKPYVLVSDAAGIVTLAQWGILEVHTWGSRADDVERPDRLIFDLDPGPDVPWAAVRAAATGVRTVLDGLGLESWLKTSGGKGLHVVVPIDRSSTWAEAGRFAEAVAERLAREAPDRIVTTMAKADRPGKVLIDWMRNTRGATSVAPWSPRARPNAGVSVPIPWSRLGAVRSGDQDTIPSVRPPARDRWAPAALRQRLTRDMIDRLAGG
jgi:bifunctional non-homologous end joining protein LigD